MRRYWRDLLAFLAGAGLVMMLWLSYSNSNKPTPEALGGPLSKTESGQQENPSVAPPECYLGVVVPRRTVAVAAQSEGQLEAVLVEVGDLLRAGAPVARLDTRLARHELNIERASLAAARAEKQRQALLVDRAEQENRRRQALSDVISQAELDLAQSAIVEAEARLRASQAETRQVEARIARLETLLERSEIRAPFAGIVAARVLDPGETVAPGTPVVRLISQSERWVRFAVPPAAASSLQVGSAVRIEPSGSEKVWTGRVEQVAPELDAPSRMLFMQAELDQEASEVAVGVEVRVSRREASHTCNEF